MRVSAAVQPTNFVEESVFMLLFGEQMPLLFMYVKTVIYAFEILLKQIKFKWSKNQILVTFLSLGLSRIAKYHIFDALWDYK